jgi:hypothetical protein
MIKPFIVKAAVKAANFAEISAFILVYLHFPPTGVFKSSPLWVAMQVSLDHCTGDAVGLWRTINRIGAHDLFGSPLNEQNSLT